MVEVGDLIYGTMHMSNGAGQELYPILGDEGLIQTKQWTLGETCSPM